MIAFSPEDNKNRNRFAEGVSQIKFKNGNFFLNARSESTIYDATDIHSYFVIEYAASSYFLRFRQNSTLPDKIKKDIETLFYSIWPVNAG